MSVADPEFPFVAAGRWRLDRALRSGVRFDLSRLADSRVIYAFRVAHSITYVGVCDSSDTTLGSRMSRYQSMTGAGTNRRIAGRIRDALTEGSEVLILAWDPGQGPIVHGICVDLVKGLENPLIRALSPTWNIHG